MAAGALAAAPEVHNPSLHALAVLADEREEDPSETLWDLEQLGAAGIPHYRHPGSNIVVIRADAISRQLAEDNWLVPDNHDDPGWYKIVVMEHVTIEKLEPFVEALIAGPDNS